MFEVITKDKFVTTPWKNGKGVTTELAISDNSSMADFDWRLSIATVSEDGAFSDFSGVERNLFLIEGQGIKLKHQLNGESQTDHLNQLLDYSSFDGASQTTGTLVDGQIKDLNLMTRQGMYEINIITCFEQAESTFSELTANDNLVFIYPLENADSVKSLDNALNVTIDATTRKLARGELLKVNQVEQLLISGSLYLVIVLKKK